jgi:hypothetical protein
MEGQVQQHQFPARLARRAVQSAAATARPARPDTASATAFLSELGLVRRLVARDLVEPNATSLSGGRSFRVEAVSPLRSEAPPPGPIGSSSAMPRSRWQASPWREPDLVMACPARLPAIQCQITDRDSNIRLRKTQAGSKEQPSIFIALRFFCNRQRRSGSNRRCR